MVGNGGFGRGQTPYEVIMVVVVVVGGGGEDVEREGEKCGLLGFVRFDFKKKIFGPP